MNMFFWVFCLIVFGYIFVLLSYLFVRIKKFQSHKYSAKNFFLLIVFTLLIVLFCLLEIHIGFSDKYLLMIISYSFFFMFIFIIMLKTLFVIIQSVRFKVKNDSRYNPFISVIVPIYGKEDVVVDSMNSILESNYSYKEVIVVYDKEDDSALKLLKENFNNKIKIIKNSSIGKWSALNTGIRKAKGEIIVNIDSDVIIKPDTLRELIKPLSDEIIAAVGSNVVIEKKGFLANILNKEYQLNNLERRLVPSINGSSLVAGNLGAFRKEVFKKILFDGKTLCEDFNFVFKMRKKEFKVGFSSSAVVFDTPPNSFSSFIKQRNRWFRGIMQVIRKSNNSSLKEFWVNLNLLELPIFSQIIFLWFIILFFLSNNYLLFFLSFIVLLFSDIIGLMVYTLKINKENIFKLLFYGFIYEIYSYYLNFLKSICTVEELSGFKVNWEKI